MPLPVHPYPCFQLPHSSLPHAAAALLPPAAAALLPPVQVATFGVGDTLLIVVVALIVFGPKKLPEISRQLGKLVFEFRKASNDFKFQIEEELRSSEQAERQKQLQSLAATPQPATPIAMTAAETISAQPAEPEEDDGGQPAAMLTPTIQPPSSGAPVESERPYGRPLPEDLAPAESLPSAAAEEMEANAQQAMRSAATQGEDLSAINSQSAEAIPTHHG